MKTCLVLRHVAFEDLGILRAPLARKGFDIVVHDMGVNDPSAFEVDTADLIVALGGPIAVYEYDAYPFLVTETRLLGQRLKSLRPTLGICLGAQLMAKALGSRVAPAPVKEIGWGPVQLTSAGRRSVLRDLEGFPVLHWHGDNLEAPSSTETLAVTDGCPCQAFAKGSNLLGLQFHLEADPQKIERWLIGHAVELKQSGCDPAEIRADTLRHGPVMAEIGAKVITKWLEGLQL